MTQSMETRIRDLGGQIYRERQAIAANPVVQGSADARRIEELDHAARWNAIALSGVNRKAEQR